MPLSTTSPYYLHTLIITFIYVIAAAGVYYSKFLRTADAYFRAGGAIPWWIAGLSMYMGNFTAYTFVGLASLVYIDGTSAWPRQRQPRSPFSWRHDLRRARHRLHLTSPPEYLESRSDPVTRELFSTLGILTTFLGSGIRLYAVSKLIETFVGFPLVSAIVTVATVVVIYTMLGGLWGVVITEVLQFVILYLAVVLLAVMCLVWINQHASWSDFFARIPQVIPAGGAFRIGARPHLGLAAGVLARRFA